MKVLWGGIIRWPPTKDRMNIMQHSNVKGGYVEIQVKLGGNCTALNPA